MQISEEGYNLNEIINHVYELQTNVEKKVYLTEQIEMVVRLMIKCKDESPSIFYGHSFEDILSRAKGVLCVKELFQSDIDALKVVLNSLPQNENTTDTEPQNNPLVFPKETLNQVLNNDAIAKFIEIEDRLIGDNYFNEQGEWKKSLDECAALIFKLQVNKYLLPKKKPIWITKICKPFFENRYKIRFSKQMQPKYRKDTKLSSYLVWIENFK